MCRDDLETWKRFLQSVNTGGGVHGYEGLFTVVTEP